MTSARRGGAVGEGRSEKERWRRAVACPTASAMVAIGRLPQETWGNEAYPQGARHGARRTPPAGRIGRRPRYRECKRTPVRCRETRRTGVPGLWQIDRAGDWQPRTTRLLDLIMDGLRAGAPGRRE
ncbi:hypothetical protein SGFS_010820 [Streptomyces graminofaciens]|uniref:Transposase n=1 Tax=Streptomyces graminofaciens TaxID=68212 RepID=A0ABM7F1Z8_9ACTN|nr:hypothetical protein SGFS_010820 [Streptomyces graminofaciens]